MKFKFLLFLTLVCACVGARAQTTAFQDDFNSAWDSGKWDVYDATHFLQRTQFGLAPYIASENGVSFARFRLHTYDADPAYRGAYLSGTEALSTTEFSLGNGVEFEARLRGKNLPRGIVFAFFTYGERGTWPETYLKEEADFEFLTNFAKDQMWLNVWDDWNPQRGGPNLATATTASGLDWSQWNTYKIRWLNDATEWYVNGTLVRRSTDILPNDPMRVRFNIWAASSNWDTAYDGALQAASSSSANKSYYLDVDWVRVRALPPPPGALAGNGSGLAATYFDNQDFTGLSLTRIDPQVKYDWGAYSPDVALGVDTFSARWTGQVQAQYSETYDFTARADDGVRLWVNGQKLVDAWKDQAATEYSGQIALVAGQKYDIKLEYYENSGGAVAQLYWSSARTPKQLVPQIQLYPTSADTTPPTVKISAPVNSRTYRSLPSATGTAADNVGVARVTVRLRDLTRNLYWNGSTWASSAVDLTASGTTSWSYALPALADNSYALIATARDAAGNKTSKTNGFSIDGTKPQITVSTPQADVTYASLSAASGTATDAGSGVAQVRGKLWRPGNNTAWNGSTWIAASSLAAAPELPANGTANWTFTLPPLANASYSFQPVARDLAGNVTYASPVRFVIASTSAAPARVLAPVTLSSASASGYEITLCFSGALDESAGDPATWQVTVNDRVVAVQSALVEDGSVSLRLPDTLRADDEVFVAWPALRDAQGRAVGGSWQGAAE